MNLHKGVRDQIPWRLDLQPASGDLDNQHIMGWSNGSHGIQQLQTSGKAYSHARFLPFLRPSPLDFHRDLGQL